MNCFSTNARDTQAVTIAAALAGVECTVTEVKTVHDKSPCNQGPCMSTEEGYIFGTAACLRHIARAAPNSGLYGSDAACMSRVDQWLDFTSTSLNVPRDAWLGPVINQKECDPAVTKVKKATVLGALRGFNTYLLNETFLSGNEITIADIYLFVSCIDLMSLVLAKSSLKPLGNVVRHFTTMLNNPACACVGAVEFCVKEAVAPKPKKVEVVVKKEEKKVEKKAENALPPSKMVLDTVKKSFFSELPFNPKFFDNFWSDVYDPEGYCCYTAVYNYNEENEIFWQTQNLLGGYVQRLDGARKVAFGRMMLTGSDEETRPWILHGAFVFRGPIVPIEVSDGNPQSEYYTWTKIDTNTEEGRAKFQEYMTGDSVNGLSVLDGRYFK
jgi:elongation factor 1-gamma